MKRWTIEKCLELENRAEKERRRREAESTEVEVFGMFSVEERPDFMEPIPTYPIMPVLPQPTQPTQPVPQPRKLTRNFERYYEEREVKEDVDIEQGIEEVEDVEEGVDIIEEV